MAKINVGLGERSYDIEVAAGALASTALFKQFIGKGGALIITNETIAPLYLQAVKNCLEWLEKCEVLILPDGEQYKTLSTLNLIFDALLAGGFARDATLIALGGGVIGDMVGFAAASYQRGVPFIQIPTTLLSQVDSSVGGKTGVNHPLGKNMIGAFYQPKAVVIDTQVLATLPDREFSAGMAEVIKYGFIYDAEFLAWLEVNIAGLMSRDWSLVETAIVRSCEIKAAVVEADEREQDRRAILNFGHTYGHAIEAHLGYGQWLHGEAVGAGMVMASELSRTMGWINEADHQRVVTLIARCGLPTKPPVNMNADAFMRYMAVDKKVAAGKLKLVLLHSLGDAVATAEFPPEALATQLAQLENA
ncbi:MAG TPA: 3-dehydroquinate synthase [Cellvibrionaceae bacterium]